MEKFYIATSTLNFNNILATESISPAAFYTKRNYGYKRFQLVAPNPLSNSLLAYSKIPFFNIEESDYDDYPLIIEISKDLLSEDIFSNSFKKNGIIILQLNKTIYLHPNKVNFLLFSKKVKKTCLIKEEPSIETKLLPVYNSNIQVVENVRNTFTWEKSIISKVVDFPDTEIIKHTDLDSKLNRLKGFYYSYFIGIMLSSSNMQKSLKEEFISITKSIVDFFNKRNKTSVIDKRILNNLNNIKLKVGESEGDKNVSTEELIEALFIEDSGIKEKNKLIQFLKHTKSGKYNFYSQLEWNIEQKKTENKITLLIDNFRDHLIEQKAGELFSKKSSRIIKYISSLKPKEDKIIDPLLMFENVNFNGCKITQLTDGSFNKKGAELYKNIINDILDYPMGDVQSFLEIKVDLAIKIGEVLKDVIKDWKDSKERIYLNSLLDNIENFQPFDIKSHQSEILQSVAVFIIKGDDPEKLIGALKQNLIVDYRIAFGLWGAIFGFSALPKTLTNILFEEKHVEITKVFYQDVQKKLHNSISNRTINIEHVIQKQPLKIKESIENDISAKVLKEKSSAKQINQRTDVPNCPKCGAKMVIRKGEYGEFYGCTRYNEGCKGNLKIENLPANKEISNDLFNIIKEFVEIHGHSTIADLIPYIYGKINIRYSVSNIESQINDYFLEELELKKIGKSKGVKKRDKGIFG